MRRYTTPTLELRIHGVVLEASDEVWVSLEQVSVKNPHTLDIELAPEDVSIDGADTVVSVTLSQAQTAEFEATTVNVQVNWITAEGKRMATDIARMDVGRNLMERVVSHG